MVCCVDARNWDEDAYRDSITKERELESLTVFRTVFAPSQNPNPDIIVAASSDGSVAPYSISSCISSYDNMRISKRKDQRSLCAEPICSLQGHDGPAYDVNFYGESEEDSLLVSCGDDGRIQGWKWKEILDSTPNESAQGKQIKPVLNLLNPQHKGPWGALSPIPENNAIAIDRQGGSIFSAAGDSCAYCWDVETSKIKMVFKGHQDYLHCIVARNSSNQIITGSEDGTIRIWDCKSGKCISLIDPEKDMKRKGTISWISCVDLDASESWMACSSGRNLSIWNLPASECVTRIATRCPTQDLLFDENHILAVGAEPLLTRFDMNGYSNWGLWGTSRCYLSVWKSFVHFLLSWRLIYQGGISRWEQQCMLASKKRASGAQEALSYCNRYVASRAILAAYTGRPLCKFDTFI